MLDKEDYVIVCGDFGAIWERKEDKCQPDWLGKEDEWQLDWLERLPFSVLFVDGNHENFDRLNAYPVEEWKGGKVHKVRPSVIHLMRGQVFTLAGKKIFTFGGARSHDITAGILEADDPELAVKEKRLRAAGALYRVNHLSWWAQEMPSEEELEEGLCNLAKHGNEVDYIISHCCPGRLLKKIDAGIQEKDELLDYFDSIMQNCKYKKWYFGHYHADRAITEREVLLYYRMIPLGETVNGDVPVLGQPRYELHQPVEFICQKLRKRGEEYEPGVQKLIGVVRIRDPYGTFSDPEEPSYDIMGLLDNEKCLYKHIPESVVRGLTKEEIERNKDLLELLTNQEL